MKYFKKKRNESSKYEVIIGLQVDIFVSNEQYIVREA